MVKVLHRIGWIGLTVIGAFLGFAVVSDLAADHRDGIPADHTGTFTTLSGHSFAELTRTSPGTARYITNLEVGYALHEATFAILFVAIVILALRRRQVWAWWTCWAVMIANVGYAVTFGRHDSTILARSLIAVIAVPVLLLACAPAVFGHRNAAAATQIAAGSGADPDR